ncbi:hypothetical protein KP509_11G067100 [Ceratopteris richardii]|uniref:Uncharacterized protein n=1 Tax=Ceratopteris richardii TaxID=49495 RepID=A0A8T2TVK3_CERRI|nr:hypothetical protein KP509_11G067100 [Ceratopteris richardii]
MAGDPSALPVVCAATPCAPQTLPSCRGSRRFHSWRVRASLSPHLCARRIRTWPIVRASTSEGPSSSGSDSSSSLTSEVKNSSLSSTVSVGCKACGKAELESGCNGEGRIQGGLGALPGFDWWPIKAYRPCPAFIQSGGKYRRSGQSLSEIAFGKKTKGDDRNVSERAK